MTLRKFNLFISIKRAKPNFSHSAVNDCHISLISDKVFGLKTDFQSNLLMKHQKKKSVSAD
jgi:hypothetical protein